MKRITVLVAAVAVALGGLLGASGVGSASAQKHAAITPAVKTQALAAFKKAGCAGCHTLSAVGAVGTRGPNLDGLYFPVADIIRQVTNGGAYMPAFGKILTPAQIKSVAAWINSVRLVRAPGVVTTRAATTKAAPTTTAATGPTITPALKAAGAAAFAKATCGSCHTLAAARAVGTRGPNFDGLYYPLADIIRQVTNGGGYMPSFRGVLTAAEIKAVAAYVDAVRLIKHP